LTSPSSTGWDYIWLSQIPSLVGWIIKLKKKRTTETKLVLSPKRFHGTAELKESSEPSKSLAANGVGPSSITLEGKETDFLDWVCNCTDQDDLVIPVLKELGTK